MGWALRHTLTRLNDLDYELYYIKGLNVYRVDVEDTVPADLDNPGEVPAVVEGQPYLSITRKVQVQQTDAQGNTQTVEQEVTQTFPPFAATVEQLEDPSTVPAVAELAQRLPWTISHGVEPVTRAHGLGVKGCIDCHNTESQFYTAKVMVDRSGPACAPTPSRPRGWTGS